MIRDIELQVRKIFSNEKEKKPFICYQAAALWYQHRKGKPFPKLNYEGTFGVLPPISQELKELFTSYPTFGEGENPGITPELISLLDEHQAVSKKLQGIFYTPYSLAQQLAYNILHLWLENNHCLPTHLPTPNSKKALLLEKKLAGLKICDPACGSGGLLVPLWLELAKLRCLLNTKQSYADVLLSILQHTIYAADIRPQAIENLRLRMALTLLENDIIPPSNFLPHLLVADALAGTKQSIWHKHFPEITKQGGFDLFITNPPYIGQKNHQAIFNKLRKNPRWKDKIFPKGDLIYLFFHLGLELTRNGGLIGAITTSYFAQSTGGKPLRNRLKLSTACRLLIDFENKKLFRTAPGQHTLLSVFQKTSNSKLPCYQGQISPMTCFSQTELYQGPDLLLQTHFIPPVIKNMLDKMKQAKTTLQEVACISNGLMTGCDKISAAHITKFPEYHFQKGMGVFVISKEEKNKLSLPNYEKNKLKPFFKNSDIKAYQTQEEPSYFLIDFFYPNDRDTDFSKYPRLMQHLARFKPVLLARKQNNNGIDKQLALGKYWFGSVRRKLNFEEEKIVVPQRARRNTFAYAPGPWYASSDVYFITAPKPPFSCWYLLALLNSAPYYTWLFFNGKRKGSLLELYAQPLKQLPIPLPSKSMLRTLECLAKKQYEHFSKNRQQKIEQLVAKIFNFSTEEQQILTHFYK